MATQAPPRPLERLLVASVLDADMPPLADEDGSQPAAVEVREAAHLHRVTPAVHRYLSRHLEAPAEWTAELRVPARMQSMRHLLALADLTETRKVLVSVATPWVAVKGPVAAECIWPSPTMREYYDLDVVVDRTRFKDVLDGLLDAGFTQVDRNWPLLEQTRRAEIAMRGPHGTPLDLHWDIAVPPMLRSAFRTDIPGMLARAREGSVGSVSSVPLLDPVDTAVHLAFHAAQGGANRLMWIADVRFAVARPGFDWPTFVSRVRSMRFEVPAALVLARVQRTLGLDGEVPLQALAPAAGLWGHLTERRDAHVPFPGLPGDVHLGGGLYATARRSVPASLAALARHVLALRSAERKQPTQPPPLYRDVPDAAARRRYLGSVTRGRRP